MIGVVLDRCVEKNLLSIFYSSHTLDVVHVNYATTKKEFLAIICTFKKLFSYLVELKVIILIDYVMIKEILAKKDVTPPSLVDPTRIWSWCLWQYSTKNLITMNCRDLLRIDQKITPKLGFP